MKIKALPKAERPVEKAMGRGVSTLSNAELIAVLLGAGTPEKSAIGVAEELLSKDERGIAALADHTPEDFMSVKGIGAFKAARIVAAIELGKRIATAPNEKLFITGTDDVVRLFMERLRYEKREHFEALLLNSKGMIISSETISVGELNSAPVHPREVFKNAVRKSAAGIVFVHNHPSGDSSPSKEDIAVTRELVQCGKLLKINVLDHIIIGDGSFTSLRSMGEI